MTESVTAGLFTHQWRLEGSVFNGREPDEERWGFDPIALDSYSGRVSYNPDAHWALNASYGFLKSPEALTPDVSMHRMTASAMYGQRLGTDGQLAATVIWGANERSDRPGLAQAALVESEAVLDRSNTVFGRVELVQKTAEDLAIDTPQLGFPSSQTFNDAAMSLGYVREILPMRVATLGLGAMGTVNVVPRSLESAYGSRTPLGVFVFLRVRPIASKRSNSAGMSSMGAMDVTGAYPIRCGCGRPRRGRSFEPNLPLAHFHCAGSSGSGSVGAPKRHALARSPERRRGARAAR